MSPARAQPTHRLHIHTARRLLAVTPAPNPTATQSRTTSRRVGGVCMRVCTLPLAPARRRLMDNNLGHDAEQTLRAAARSGLELKL